jgi:formate dehydrogenase major subunit
MAVSRRGFLKATGASMAGTAVGALSGLGADLQPKVARAQELRIRNAKVYPSICPYCAVGCGQLVHVQDGRIVNIEGNPDSPVSEGNLCPKGAATYQLAVNPNRVTEVLYRAPGSDRWERKELNWAMDRVAELTKKTRDETFVERSPDNKVQNSTLGIFALGGATMDNELNYTWSKLLRGLGIVAIENQARI